MIDHETLLAISTMMDGKLDPIREDVKGLKTEVKNLELEILPRLKSLEQTQENEILPRLKSLEQTQENELLPRLKSLEQTQENEILPQLKDLEHNQKRIIVPLLTNEVVPRIKSLECTNEMEILPQLATIESCYTSTYERYKDGVEQQDSMQRDLAILKQVVTGHSKRLLEIS